MHIIEEMEPSLKFLVMDLGQSEFSTPNIFTNSDETNAYRLIKVKSKLNAHKANLSDDFYMIKEFALNIKKQDELFEWIKNTVNTTYIEINSNILTCNFKNKWIK